MSEHHRGAWGAREDAVWWPGAITTDQQQTLQSHHQHLLNQHHQQQLAAAQQQAVAQQQQQQQAQQQQQEQQQQAQQQQAQQQQQAAAQAAHQQQQQQQQQQQAAAQAAHDAAVARSTAAAAATHQLFSYKMASSFQNPATTGTVASVSSTSPVGAAGIRGYDYRLGGGMVNVGGATLAGAAPTAQWWYPGAMENAMQNMQNVSTPPPQQNQQNQAQQQAAQQAQQQAQQQVHNQQQQQQPQQLHNQQIQSPQIQQQPQTPRGRMPRAKADSKPRGRMTAYAFFVQTCREEHKKKHPEENVIFAEFSRKCAERWKTMLDKEKKRFHEMAEKDKARYDSEMLNYTPPKGGEVKQRGKKRKQIKDPNAPKRSLSAFFWFCNDERSKVKAINPEYGVGDIAKELGRRWSDVEPELKSKYEAMAEQDKARYDREMTAYKKRIKPENNVPEPVEEEEEEEAEEEDDE